MAVSETTFDASAAELINLKKILEACIFVPDISDAGRQAGLSREQRFCYALGRFETTVRVFDQSHYESEVLHIGSKESEADEGLRKEAREGGVPDNHFPSTAKRRRIQRLSRHQAGLRPYSTFEPGIERRNTAIMLDATRFAAAQNFGPLSPLPRISISSRPSMNLAASEPRPVQDANALHSLPTPATSSVVSFKTTSSQSSWFSNKLLGKRRDSLMHFFRRDSSRASSSSGGDQVPVTPLSPGEPPASYNQNSIAEEPESASSNSHESKDFSSNQSLSISTRTSSSSFTEQPQPFQDISNLDKQKLKNFMQTKPFIQLRTSCEEEMQRFNGFAADQHVSLPLILGRNHVYNQERMKFRLAELRKEHALAIEQMEDRHAEKELIVEESLRDKMEENAAWNATAVKHVARRIALLGDNATPEHMQRLEEEQTALNRLAKRHEVDMRNLVRYQESKKLELLRKQEKEYDELSQTLVRELEVSRKDKTSQLQTNISKLDELLEERRARIVARWFLRLQMLKSMSNDTAAVEAALPLSILGLPSAFTVGLGYS